MSKSKSHSLPKQTSHSTSKIMQSLSEGGSGEFFSEVGGLARFTGNFFKYVFRRPFELKEIMRQSYFAGYKSLGLVAITGFIMGVVLTIQTRPTLARFGAE